MVRKKQIGKRFEDENIHRITVKSKNILKKYILVKKENANLGISIEKIKSHAIGWSKEEKNTVRAAKLQRKKCSILNRAK